MSIKRPNEALIYKVQTLADGGARITLDLGYDEAELIKYLINKKMSGDELMQFVIINDTERYGGQDA